MTIKGHFLLMKIVPLIHPCILNSQKVLTQREVLLELDLSCFYSQVDWSVKLKIQSYEKKNLNFRLTIQWTNVTVAEPFEHPNGGAFTFQV
jgi:hypothetical protein